MKKWLVSLALLMSCLYGEAESNDPPTNPRPLWELGVFAGIAKIPHYRGSDEYSTYTIPFPYIIYREEKLKADRDSIRGVFYDSPHFEVTFSLYGNPPPKNEDKAREGMPDLDTVLEIGPAVKWFFLGRMTDKELYARLAVRGVTAVDGSLESRYEGIHNALTLTYEDKAPFGDQTWDMTFHATVDYCDKDYHSYFYGVDREFVTPTRPFYKARGGYSGFILSGSAMKDLSDNLTCGMYARWENCDGTVYQDSPLVTAKNSYTVGAAVIWKFAKSKKPEFTLN